ncbi:MAG: response regulator transcription factor, partial [Campylobacter sp.]|nr:response regulator transcription factor [Campylobacter sp.]
YQMIKILLIEDDIKPVKPLELMLAKEGIKTTVATNPLVGIEILKNVKSFDALVLDLSLPDMDGFEVCEIVRKSYPSLPIIISSARSEILDKIKAFELGADDYMTKPYEPIELVFRLRAILRRGTSSASDKIFTIDISKGNLFKNGKQIPLTKSEFEIFLYLFEKEGFVVPREDILLNLGEQRFNSGLKTIDVTIGRLRQKIGDDPKNPRFIHTIRSVGYKFINE